MSQSQRGMTDETNWQLSSTVPRRRCLRLHLPQLANSIAAVNIDGDISDDRHSATLPPLFHSTLLLLIGHVKVSRPQQQLF